MMNDNNEPKAISKYYQKAILINIVELLLSFGSVLFCYGYKEGTIRTVVLLIACILMICVFGYLSFMTYIKKSLKAKKYYLIPFFTCVIIMLTGWLFIFIVF